MVEILLKFFDFFWREKCHSLCSVLTTKDRQMNGRISQLVYSDVTSVHIREQGTKKHVAY